MNITFNYDHGTPGTEWSYKNPPTSSFFFACSHLPQWNVGLSRWQKADRKCCEAFLPGGRIRASYLAKTPNVDAKTFSLLMFFENLLSLYPFSGDLQLLQRHPNIVLFLDIKLTSCCPKSCQGFPSLSCVGSEVASIPLELVEWGELCWQPSSFRRDPFQQKIYTQIDDPCFVLVMPISLPCTCQVNASKRYDQNKQHLSLLMKSLWKSLEVTKQNPEIENSTKEISNNIVGENGSMLLCSLKVGFAILFNSVIGPNEHNIWWQNRLNISFLYF